MHTNQPAKPEQPTETHLALDQGGSDDLQMQIERGQEAAFMSKMNDLSNDLDAFISAGNKQLTLSSLIFAEAANRQDLPT